MILILRMGIKTTDNGGWFVHVPDRYEFELSVWVLIVFLRSVSIA